MNAPALTCHLLLKDFRHQRAWLVLLWGYALLIPLIARTMNGTREFVVPLASVCLFVLLFRLLGSAVRLDAPGRNTHFLSIRPVPWAVLLVSKLAFIGLFLLVPAGIAKLGCIFLLGIPVNTMDVVLMLTEGVITAGVLLGIVMLFAMFLRSVALALLSLAAAGIIITFGIPLVHFPASNTTSLPQFADVTLAHTRSLVFAFGIILTTVTVGVFRYRRKKIMAPLCALAAGITLSIYISDYWSYDLSRYFTDKSRTAGASQPGARFKLVLQGGVNEFSHMQSSSTGGVSYVSFQHEVSVEGVEPPYYASFAGYTAVAVLKSGHTIPSVYTNPASPLDSEDSLSEQLRVQVAGFTQAKDAQQAGNERSFEVFNYRPCEYKNEDQTGVTIKGILTLEIRKVAILKTIPFKSGGTVAVRRQRYLLQNVSFGSNDAECKIITDFINLTLRGDNISPGTPEFLTWLVFNRDKGEYLVSERTGSSSTETGSFYEYADRTVILTSSHSGNEDERKPIPSDWADKAEIAFFSSEPGERVNIPYEIKDVDLTTFTAHSKK